MSLGERFNCTSATMIERVLAGTGFLALLIGCLFAGLFNPSITRILPPCLLLSITGLACPGCGLTRGFHELFHGDVFTALDYNALIPFYALGFGYFAASLFLIVVRGRGLPYKFVGPVALGVFFTVSIIFGIIRNIPAYPFSILYP